VSPKLTRESGGMSDLPSGHGQTRI